MSAKAVAVGGTGRTREGMVNRANLRLWRNVAVIAALIAASAGTATAIDQEIVNAQAGTWLVAPEDGAPGCRLTLMTETGIGGYAVSGAEACETALPQIASAAAWNFGDMGDLLLIDPTRHVLARFEEQEGTPLRAGGDQPLLLVKAPDGVDHLPTAQDFSGRWTVRDAAGKALCAIALATRADAAGLMDLALPGDCAKSIATLKLYKWQIQACSLILLGSDGEALTFASGGTAARLDRDLAGGGAAMTLVRQ